VDGSEHDAQRDPHRRSSSADAISLLGIVPAAAQAVACAAADVAAHHVNDLGDGWLHRSLAGGQSAAR
jgi:hypothetical protein